MITASSEERLKIVFPIAIIVEVAKSVGESYRYVVWSPACIQGGCPSLPHSPRSVTPIALIVTVLAFGN